MPTVSDVGALWDSLVRVARTTPPAASSAADPRMASLFIVVSSLVPVDPLLGADPLVEVLAVRALALGLHPGVVRVLRLARLVVEDAEVDQRLGRVVAHVLERLQV